MPSTTLSAEDKKTLSLISEIRLQILKFIYEQRENVCGMDMVKEIKIPKNLLSYHLKQLREEGIIEEVKCGKFKNYTITKHEIPRIEKIFALFNFNNSDNV